jgi:hypothetical protein
MSEVMEAPPRGALTLVRLIGTVGLLVSLLELGLYWAQGLAAGHHAQWRILPVLLRLIPAAVGLVILIRARAIADWVADKLDL